VTAPILIAGPEYAAVIAGLQNACFPEEPWDEQSVRSLLAAPFGFAMLADSGFALGRVVAGEAEILSLGVWPEARGKGLGGALLDRLIQESRARGAGTLLLEVAANNVPALALYHRRGFIEIGRRRAYYADGRDAILLRLTL